MSCDGKLVNAYIGNPNNESEYRGFEIVTCREISDYNGGSIIEEVKTAEEYLNADQEALDDPFYRIFAVYRPESYRITSDEEQSIDNDLSRRRAIGDFYKIDQAVTFLQELTGKRVDIYSY